jgi:hypothetical protein
MHVMCRIAGPYPFLSANILKLFADAQVFVVALVGLVLRMDEDLYDREFFGNVMLVLLVSTLLPALATLVYKTPVERALVSLQKIANALPDPSAAVSAPTPTATAQPVAQVHHDNHADLEARGASVVPEPELEPELEPEPEMEPEPERDKPPTGSKMATSNEEQEQEEKDVALLPDPTRPSLVVLTRSPLDKVSRGATGGTSLMCELQQLKLRDLRKRAVSMGVAMEEVEEARDSDSPKKNLIALIVTRAAAAAGSPAGARP